MWVSCFANSNYNSLYTEYEQLQEGFGWSIFDSRKLSYRERKHWVARYLHKLEKEYERLHQLNNSNQVITKEVGSGVTFGGVRFK